MSLTDGLMMAVGGSGEEGGWLREPLGASGRDALAVGTLHKLQIQLATWRTRAHTPCKYTQSIIQCPMPTDRSALSAAAAQVGDQ